MTLIWETRSAVWGEIWLVAYSHDGKRRWEIRQNKSKIFEAELISGECYPDRVFVCAQDAKSWCQVKEYAMGGKP